VSRLGCRALNLPKALDKRLEQELTCGASDGVCWVVHASRAKRSLGAACTKERGVGTALKMLSHGHLNHQSDQFRNARGFPVRYRHPRVKHRRPPKTLQRIRGGENVHAEGTYHRSVVEIQLLGGLRNRDNRFQ
jgi:hypothetical protein